MNNRVTMADVAREAGVSQMTVSRVVNEKGEVSETTRRRVLDIVERLGFRPSGIARGLATQRTGTLGLVVPDVANPFFADVARGVEDAAYAGGYNVFLCNTEENPRRELDVLGLLVDRRVDGLVLCSSRLGDSDLVSILEHFPAAVLVNRRLEDSDTIAVLLADSEGARDVTHHLLQTGHVSVGFLAGPGSSFSGRLRAEGYTAALAAAGIAPDKSWIWHCAPDVDGGLEAASALLTRVPDLTALFCFNDLVAVGALQACVRLGRDVPEQVAVAGFDDIPLSSLVTPSLTTCRVPRNRLGVQAVDALLRRIEGDPTSTGAAILVPQLVVRASAPYSEHTEAL